MHNLVCANCGGGIQATRKDYWDVKMTSEGIVTAEMPEGWDESVNFPVWDIYCSSDCEPNTEWGSGGRLFQDAESLQLAMEDLIERGFVKKAKGLITHEKEVGINEQGIDSQTVNKIVKARITQLPRRLGDPVPEVWIELTDGTEKLLFTYYSDEISFSESDFTGLTEEEARLLKFGRDRAYLQS